MYGRRYQKKRGFKRTLVLLLTLVMLASVCFPGLRASAEGETADVEVKAGEKAEYSVSGEIGNIVVVQENSGLVFEQSDGKIIVDATNAVPGTYKVVYVAGSDSEASCEVTFTVRVVASEPEDNTEQEIENLAVEDEDTVDEKTTDEGTETSEGADNEEGSKDEDTEKAPVGDSENKQEETDIPESDTASVLSITPYASRTTNFSPVVIEHATVAYVHYTSNTKDVASLSFTEVTGNFQLSYNDSVANYWVVFVKPDDNYLLTGLGAFGAGNMYPTSGTTASDFGAMSGYPNLAKLAAVAKEQGYVALFGWSRSAGDTLSSADFTVKCESPDITVTATSNKTENVKPDDELTFRVTITPGRTSSGKDKVENVEIKTITVNGKEVTYSAVTDNGDGTYTVTVDYTAKADDCASGNVKLDVTASVEYSGTFTLSDESGTTGSVNTNAVITKSATTICQIAPKNQVTYTHTYDVPDGVTITKYPESITGNPVDSKDYYSGETVSVDTTYPNMGEIVDTENGGKWTFDGWYLGNQKVTTATMDADGLTFTGVWKFEKTLCTITVKKIVTGNMGDYSKEFTFSVTVNGETFGESFTLSNGGEATISNVPLGATVVITETGNDGYEFTADVKETEQESVNSSSVSFTASENVNHVEITNKKEATIDTGIFTDTAPYIILFSVAAVGAAVLLTKKRRYQV